MQLKFRAWHTEIQRMFPAEELGADEMSLHPNGRGFFNAGGSTQNESEYYSNMIPMQFTGITDDEGVEIYEGDIISYGQFTDGSGECLHEVVWNDRDAGFKTVQLNEHGQPDGSGNYPLDNGSAIVIGNKYERAKMRKAKERAEQPIGEVAKTEDKSAADDDAFFVVRTKNGKQASDRAERYIANNSKFMVDDLALGAGISSVEALSTCMLLFHFGKAEIYLITYIGNKMIHKGKFAEGFPTLPLHSLQDDSIIESLEHAQYAFAVEIKEDADVSPF